MEIQYLLKALHIIGFVTWFAGLFGVVFLMILRVRSGSDTGPELARKMYKRIANPAMMLTWTAGLILIGLGIGNEEVPNYLKSGVGTPGWMHAKLLFVLILLGAHLYTKRLVTKMELSPTAVSAGQLNVLATALSWLLITIVFLATFGSSGMLNYMYWGIGIIVAAPVLWVVISRK
jgi:putative membrane protein